MGSLDRKDLAETSVLSPDCRPPSSFDLADLTFSCVVRLNIANWPCECTSSLRLHKATTRRRRGGWRSNSMVRIWLSCYPGILYLAWLRRRYLALGPVPTVVSHACRKGQAASSRHPAYVSDNRCILVRIQRTKKDCAVWAQKVYHSGKLVVDEESHVRREWTCALVVARPPTQPA